MTTTTTNCSIYFGCNSNMMRRRRQTSFVPCPLIFSSIFVIIFGSCILNKISLIENVFLLFFVCIRSVRRSLVHFACHSFNLYLIYGRITLSCLFNVQQKCGFVHWNKLEKMNKRKKVVFFSIVFIVSNFIFRNSIESSDTRTHESDNKNVGINLLLFQSTHLGSTERLEKYYFEIDSCQCS